MTRPLYQERHHDYVLGPNQDSRLASVAAGATVSKVKLTLDPDAPFALRGRAVRQKYSSTLTQGGLAGIQTQWCGPGEDYRMSTFPARFARSRRWPALSCWPGWRQATGSLWTSAASPRC